MYLRITKYYYFCSQSRLPVFSGTKHGSPGPSGCGYPRYLQNGPEYQHPMSRWVRIARHLQFAGSPEKNFEWKCCSGTENLFKHWKIIIFLLTVAFVSISGANTTLPNRPDADIRDICKTVRIRTKIWENPGISGSNLRSGFTCGAGIKEMASQVNAKGYCGTQRTKFCKNNAHISTGCMDSPFEVWRNSREWESVCSGVRDIISFYSSRHHMAINPTYIFHVFCC